MKVKQQAFSIHSQSTKVKVSMLSQTLNHVHLTSFFTQPTTFSQPTFSLGPLFHSATISLSLLFHLTHFFTLHAFSLRPTMSMSMPRTSDTYKTLVGFPDISLGGMVDIGIKAFKFQSLPGLATRPIPLHSCTLFSPELKLQNLYLNLPIFSFILWSCQISDESSCLLHFEESLGVFGLIYLRDFLNSECAVILSLLFLHTLSCLSDASS